MVCGHRVDAPAAPERPDLHERGAPIRAAGMAWPLHSVALGRADTSTQAPRPAAPHREGATIRNPEAMTLSPDGRELMLAVKVGCDGAFDHLTREYGAYIRNVIRRYVKEQSMVDDLSQDVLLRLYGSRLRYEPVAPFEVFLKTIIFNLCLNHLRYHKRRRATSLSSLGDGDEPLGNTLSDPRGDMPERDAMRHERALAVREAIRRLPTNQRRALELAHFSGLPHEEVSRRVGLSVAAVKSLVWRARENLRRMLSVHLSDPGEFVAERSSGTGASGTASVGRRGAA